MFKIHLLFSWQTFWSNSEHQCFICSLPITLGNVVLSCTQQTVLDIHLIRDHYFPPIRSLPLSLSTSFCLDLIPNLLHTLYTCCIHLVQPLNKDCLYSYFSSLHSLSSHLPLSLYPLDLFPPSSCLLTLCFSLCVWNISVRHKVKLQKPQDLKDIPFKYLNAQWEGFS